MPSTASTPEWHYRSVVPASEPGWWQGELRNSLVDLWERAGSFAGGSDTSEGHASAHGSARHYIPLGTHRPFSRPRLVDGLGDTL